MRREKRRAAGWRWTGGEPSVLSRSEPPESESRETESRNRGELDMFAADGGERLAILAMPRTITITASRAARRRRAGSTHCSGSTACRSRCARRLLPPSLRMRLSRSRKGSRQCCRTSSRRPRTSGASRRASTRRTSATAPCSRLSTSASCTQRLCTSRLPRLLCHYLHLFLVQYGEGERSEAPQCL